MKLQERAAVLKRDIPAVFLALKSKETPIYAKILAGLTAAYALPIVAVWALAALLIRKAFF